MEFQKAMQIEKGTSYTRKIQVRYYSKYVAITMEIQLEVFDRYLNSKSSLGKRHPEYKPEFKSVPKEGFLLWHKYCGTLNGKNRWVKSAKEADWRYFDGNYWKTQDLLISSRDPSQSFSRDAKNTHEYKMPNQLASQGGARTKEEKSQHVT